MRQRVCTVARVRDPTGHHLGDPKIVIPRHARALHLVVVVAVPMGMPVRMLVIAVMRDLRRRPVVVMPDRLVQRDVQPRPEFEPRQPQHAQQQRVQSAEARLFGPDHGIAEGDGSRVSPLVRVPRVSGSNTRTRT